MNYPNKREIIQEILEENGCLDWYVAQPDKQNPASANAKCILLNFVEKKRAELIIPNEWFQDPCRYGEITELIGWPFKILRQSSRNIPHIIFFLSQDSQIKMATEAGTESNFRVPFLSGLYHLSVRRILSVSDDYRVSTR